MHVAMVIRPDASDRPGGDVVQAEKTAEALRRLGVSVTISAGEDVARADVVHVFNLQTADWTLGQVLTAKRLGKPVVLSPIYWQDLRLPLGAVLQLGAVLPHLGHAWSAGPASTMPTAPRVPVGHRTAARAVLGRVDAILPNSQVEARHLLAEFPRVGRSRIPTRVVPNGVDAVAFDRTRSQSVDSAELDLPREFVLCASRIEYRKNTLALIRATNRLGLALVLAGASVDFTVWHRAYAAACRAEGPGVRFLGALPQDRLWPLYTASSVHALPSFFETPGLSSLEAALAGTRIVTTPNGSTREYFGDLAEYCEPTSVRSIASAIERAWARPRSNDLAALIRERYTWDRAAAATLEAYRQLTAR